MSSQPKTEDGPPQPSAVELRKVLTLEQVTVLTTLSADSLKRHHADRILHLGPRRLRHAPGRRARHRHIHT